MGRGITKGPIERRNQKIYRTFYPVPKIKKELKLKCGNTPATFLASVIEYFISEVVELSANCAIDQKKKSIYPRHVMLAIRNDEELENFFKGVTFTSSGNLLQIHQNLLPPSTKKEKKSTEEATQPAVN